jgi:mRNA interferase YafQ
MYRPVTTKQFNKDLKRAAKRGKDLSKLQAIMKTLAAGEALPQTNRDHPLIGNFAERRECHIEPDWLLIYKLDTDHAEIIFERTGTHSDLFS